jgi:hypothetical protein
MRSHRWIKTVFRNLQRKQTADEAGITIHKYERAVTTVKYLYAQTETTRLDTIAIYNNITGLHEVIVEIL